MDKILSELEKQRRAENIYNSRRSMNYYQEQDSVKKNKSIYKFLFQILFLINIALYIYCMQNQNYIFKEEFLLDVGVFIENVKLRAKNEEILFDNSIENNVLVLENTIATTNETSSLNIIKEEKQEVSVQSEDIKDDKSAEQKEIEALIGMYQFKDPIGDIGVITSNYGDRVSENINVSEYHTGIDIGAPFGTDIKSSVTGIVTLVSNSGDYRKTSKSSK